MEQLNVALQIEGNGVGGRVELELYWQHAPQSCARLVARVQRGAYNGVAIPRIVSNFLMQTSSPNLNSGSEEENGDYDFRREINPLLRHTGAGIVCLATQAAKERKNDSGQLFITLAPAPWLDGKYVILGRVKSGMRVIKGLSLLPVDQKDKPLSPVRIVSATTVPID